MGFKTLNGKTDLTYEEIYEGYANGKSRLPMILKDIQENREPFAAIANGAGIDIKRRRTGGGNATNVSGLGKTVSNPVAKLVSYSRYTDLITNYSNPVAAFDSPPSRKYIDIDVNGFAKEPFDLLDFISGINNAEQVKNAGRGLVGRAAKFQEVGSRSLIRNITQEIIPETQDFDVRALNNDRIGGGGSTGEAHGADLGLSDLVDVKSEALIVGVTGESFDFAADSDLTTNIDGLGGAIVDFGSGVLSAERAVLVGNSQLNLERSQRDALFLKGGQIALRSQDLGGTIEITEANTVLGFPGATAENIIVGATLASASVAPTGSAAIELGADSVDRLTNIRYGTFQFATARIFNSINDANPVAVVLHPDLLSDLIRNNP